MHRGDVHLLEQCTWPAQQEILRRGYECVTKYVGHKQSGKGWELLVLPRGEELFFDDDGGYLFQEEADDWDEEWEGELDDDWDDEEEIEPPRRTAVKIARHWRYQIHYRDSILQKVEYGRMFELLNVGWTKLLGTVRLAEEDWA